MTSRDIRRNLLKQELRKAKHIVRSGKQFRITKGVAPYYPGTPVLNGRSAHWVKGKLVDRAENLARMAADRLRRRKRPQDQGVSGRNTV